MTQHFPAHRALSRRERAVVAVGIPIPVAVAALLVIAADWLGYQLHWIPAPAFDLFMWVALAACTVAALGAAGWFGWSHATDRRARRRRRRAAR